MERVLVYNLDNNLFVNLVHKSAKYILSKEIKFDFYFAVSKTLDNLWTVLRNIRSATACPPNSESIQKRKLHVCNSIYSIHLS